MTKEQDLTASMYYAVREGRRMLDTNSPIIEQILSHGAGAKLTARQIGLEIMGEEYNDRASYKACSMSSTIGNAFSKLAEFGYVTAEVAYDKEHPRTFVSEDRVYYDANGNKYGDKIEVILPTGEKTTMRTYYLDGFESKVEQVTYTVYPKVTYWTLTDKVAQ